MRRLFFTVFVVLMVLGVSGYSAGLFTDDVRNEDACLICRASRFSGRHYGFGYERVEDTVLTRWYRENIDPRHGLDPAHPHEWRRSGCAVSLRPGTTPDFDRPWVAPIFLLRPEIELDVLQRIPDRPGQVAMMHALSCGDRTVASARIRTLVQYYYVEQYNTSWDRWWPRHAAEFGVTMARRNTAIVR